MVSTISLKVNAVVVYYLDSKTIDNGTTVKLSYIFWMGWVRLGFLKVRIADAVV